MKLAFLSPRIHGLLDYAAALGLIALPFILGLGEIDPIAQWLSVAAGVGLIGYSLLTDYEYGPLKALSFHAHLILDRAAAIAFVAAPFLFGWTGLVMGYYFVMAAGVLLVVFFTNADDAAGPVTDSVAAS